MWEKRLENVVGVTRDVLTAKTTSGGVLNSCDSYDSIMSTGECDEAIDLIMAGDYGLCLV